MASSNENARVSLPETAERVLPSIHGASGCSRASKAELHNWSRIPVERMNELLSRQVIHTETMTLCRLRLGKGAVVPMHQHPNEQVTTMEAGSLRFVVAGEEVIVRAGESLRIPPNAPHMVETLEDSVAFDLFAPPRQDWISGDDAYLRK